MFQNISHKALAAVAALGVILPSMDQLPAGTPKWIKTLVAAIGFVMALSADRKTVTSMKSTPPPTDKGL